MRLTKTPEVPILNVGYKDTPSPPAQTGVDYSSGGQGEGEGGLAALVGIIGKAQAAGLTKGLKIGDKGKATTMPEAPKKKGFLGIEWNTKNKLKIASMFNKGSVSLGGANAKHTMNSLAIGFARLTKGIETEEEKGTPYG